jgi:hypothetical protein
VISLIDRAKAEHGTILPCGGKACLEDCITEEPGVGRIFWFNTPDGSTHVEIEAKK